QMDLLRDSGEYVDIRPAAPRLGDAVLRVLETLPGLVSVRDRVMMARVSLEYETQSARYQSSQRVLSTLDELARVESTPWYIVDKMRRQYHERSEAARQNLDRIAEQHPDFVSDLQELLGQKLLILARAEAVNGQAARGTISAEVAEVLLRKIKRESHNLKRYRTPPIKLQPADLVRRWPPLQGLPTEAIASIVMRLHQQPLREGEVAIRQGEPAGSMYFIAHGVVRLSREGQGGSDDVATFIAGDYFGDD